jgi:hypothetical protein
VPKASAEPIVWGYATEVQSFSPLSGEDHYGNGMTTTSADRNAFVVLGDTLGQSVGSPTGVLQAMSVTPYYTGGPFGLNFSGAHFSAAVNTFDLMVRLSDENSHTGGNLFFHGGVNGPVGMTVGKDSISTWSSLSLTYSQLTQSLQLGNHLYTVTMDGSTLGGMRVQVSDVPEPSTLALAALGLSGLGLRAWRRRRSRLTNPA